MPYISEAEMNRPLTLAFIQTRPMSVVLTPWSRVDDDSGGWDYEEGTARAVQVMRLIEPGGSPENDYKVQRTVDGTERDVEFQLLAPWDAIMERGDRFTHDGVNYEITYIWPDNGYERRATVVSRG